MKLTVELWPQWWDLMTYCSNRECTICHTDSWACIKTCPTHKNQDANTSRNRRNLTTIPDQKEKVREVPKCMEAEASTMARMEGALLLAHATKRKLSQSIDQPPRACLPRPLLQRQDNATTFGISNRYIRMNISRQYCVQQIRPNSWHTARKSHE